MAYGSALVDNIQSSTANTPVVFKDGNGTQIGTLCRAWVNFDGTTSPGTIRASFNVSSITRNSTGNYNINFTNAFSDANYSTLVTCSTDGATIRTAQTWSTGAYMTTSTCQVNVATTNTTAPVDCAVVTASFFR